MDELDLAAQEENKRGGMLTTLCVLSWIYIGIGFISMIISLTQGKMTEAELEEQKYEILKGMDESTPAEFRDMMVNMVETLEKQNEYFWMFQGIHFVEIVLGFFAVLLMFKLRKLGYWLYLVYAIVPLIINFAILGDSKLYMFGILFLAAFSILFIILYGTQLKKMS